jgi:hypothetical protein
VPDLEPFCAVRLGDLRPWHRLSLTCRKCGHHREVGAERFRQLCRERKARRNASASPRWIDEEIGLERLSKLEAKLRCTECGSSGAAAITIRSADRDD